MTIRTRWHPSTRRAALLETTIHLSESMGYLCVSRDAIAVRAGVSAALVSHYLGPIESIRRAVMVAAVDREILPIIAQGLTVGDEIAVRAPDYLKRKAARSLMRE